MKKPSFLIVMMAAGLICCVSSPTAVQAQPQVPLPESDPLLQEISSHIMKRNYAEGEKLLGQAEALDPDNPFVKKMRMLSEARQGHWWRAKKIAKKLRASGGLTDHSEVTIDEIALSSARVSNQGLYHDGQRTVKIPTDWIIFDDLTNTTQLKSIQRKIDAQGFLFITPNFSFIPGIVIAKTELGTSVETWSEEELLSKLTIPNDKLVEEYGAGSQLTPSEAVEIAGKRYICFKLTLAPELDQISDVCYLLKKNVLYTFTGIYSNQTAAEFQKVWKTVLETFKVQD